MVPGRHVPHVNDSAAVEAAISPATAAVLIEGIQGEGGVTPATVEYLLGLRKLCTERRLLLMMDEAVRLFPVRAGSAALILETPGGEQFLPDAISMAKSPKRVSNRRLWRWSLTPTCWGRTMRRHLADVDGLRGSVEGA